MNRLKEIRKENNVTQAEIAKLLSVNVKTVSRWENGEYEIKLPQAKMLAERFGVWVPYLLGDSSIKTEAKAKRFAEINTQLNESLEENPPILTIESTDSDEHDLLYNYRQLKNPYKDHARKVVKDIWELQKENDNQE